MSSIKKNQINEKENVDVVYLMLSAMLINVDIHTYMYIAFQLYCDFGKLAVQPCI